MIALVIMLVRLSITCLILTARLTYWMLKAVVVLITAATAAISASGASRQRRPARRR
jgi:hypothetical protein